MNSISDNAKPKIALVIDSPNWSFSNIAKQIVKNLSYKYNFIVIPSEYINDVHRILLMTIDCDLVHFFWRDLLFSIDYPWNKEKIEQLGINQDDFIKKFVFNRKITTSIYDHLFLNAEKIEKNSKYFNHFISAYTVSSNKLMSIYENLPNHIKPHSLTEDGVDLDLFKPINIDRFINRSERELVVGWVGNSNWASESGKDFKGFHTIVKPAIDELKLDGYKVKIHAADRQNGFISHADMPNYYSEIDVYVCSSEIEGTPNPVLEAMACGVPVISTDVGVVPDVFGNDKYGLILKQRTVSELKNKIIKIYNMDSLIEISNHNTELIKEWDWGLKVKKFESFFDYCLEKNHI